MTESGFRATRRMCGWACSRRRARRRRSSTSSIASSSAVLATPEVKAYMATRPHLEIVALDARRVRHVLPRGKGPLGQGRPRDGREDRLTGAPMTASTTEAPATGRRRRALDRSKGDVRLFLWEKYVGTPDGKPACSSSTARRWRRKPTFDLTVPGRPDSSVMDWFARRGFVVLVRRHGRLRPLRQAPRHPLRHRERRRRPRRGDRLHHAHARRESVPRLRHLVGRAARRAVRRSAIRTASRAWRSTRSSGPAKAAPRSSSGARSCPSS